MPATQPALCPLPMPLPVRRSAHSALRKPFRCFIGVWVVVAAVSVPVRLPGQTPIPGQPTPAYQPRNLPGSNTPLDSPAPQLTPKLEAQRAEEQHQQLIRESHRLVLLTLDLKEQIAASGSSTLTPEMRRRTEEIEKLARAIHRQMLN